ncbi:unnamed protein product [Fusarium equiseti]|uniref:Uncharacterized protein n=1 Tax=Fusarium equiseti TaxID=61235 RepID=A0A8J2ND57_FUSEQ|nr:unnamed protein product [Fusarium equiseti]
MISQFELDHPINSFGFRLYQLFNFKVTPGTYSCTPDSKGWQVCNVDHSWVVSILFAGVCPPKTACLFNKVNGSPYCVPPGFHFRRRV